MKFKSKPEAMSHAILLLTEMKSTDAISAAIENIKICFENHEQDMEKICQYLKGLLPSASEADIKTIEQIMNDIRSSDYVQTLQEKFDNPLARRAESELFAHLLLEPSDAMMVAVKEVSSRILQIINNNRSIIMDNPDFKTFMSSLSQSNSMICGSFQYPPNLIMIMMILSENASNNLPQILCIHFQFARHFSREFPIKNVTKHAPVGKLALILNNDPSIRKYTNFFCAIELNSPVGKHYRGYIADKLMCHSPLYRFYKGKGRKKEFDQTASTNQLGLMRKYQKLYASELPLCTPYDWIPDCKAQDPDFKSPHVLDLINNDSLYVSGPSGMTALFLGQMEFMVNFDSVVKKQHYLSAVAAFIVGTGLHSLHEVIGPAQYCLGLVPDYPVLVPGKLKTFQEQKLSPAPQHHTYFKQQMKIDKEFSAKRDAAWARYLIFYKKYFLISHQPIINIPTVEHTPAETKKNPSPATESILYSEPTKELTTKFVGYSTLTKAAALNDMGFIQRCISKDSKVIHSCDQNKNTPLLSAVKHGHYKLVEYLLLEHLKVDIEQINEDGNTALMLAAEKGHVDIFKLLLSHNADINEVNHYGETAASLAANHSQDEILSLLDQSKRKVCG